jgi:sulfur carrier protein
MAIELLINGRQERLLACVAGDSLAQVVTALDLKSDRIAIEHNGDLAPRDTWNKVAMAAGDRLEIVHFVGGGTG